MYGLNQSFFAICCLLTALPVAAQSLMVSPGTLVLDERQRAGSMTVGTTGDRDVTFEVSDGFYVQGSEGQLASTEPKAHPASLSGFVRVGPRRFVAPPGRGQQVRIAVRPPRDLAAGEYRLHLVTAAVGDSGAAAEETARTDSGEGLSVVIPIRVARAVRVLYRHKVRPEGGDVEGVSAEVRGEKGHVSYDVLRRGPTSLIGATSVTAEDAAGKEIGRWDGPGVNIYPENEIRRYEVEIPAEGLAKAARVCVILEVTDTGADDLPPRTACTG